MLNLMLRKIIKRNIKLINLLYKLNMLKYKLLFV